MFLIELQKTIVAVKEIFEHHEIILQERASKNIWSVQ